MLVELLMKDHGVLQTLITAHFFAIADGQLRCVLQIAQAQGEPITHILTTLA
jgi:hypothetical protein